MWCFSRMLAYGFVVAWAASLATHLVAQERLRVGQDVEVQVRGQWIKGEVLRMMPDGQSVQVRIRQGGRSQAGVVPLRSVRVPESEASSRGGAGGAAPASGAMRTWSDSTGQFQIEAALVAKEGELVKLRKKDGSEVRVPIAKLSRADVEYLAAAPDPAAAPRGGSGFQVNDRVEVMYGSRWRPATVLKVEGPRCFIHYDNHSDSWDEWVGPDRLRRPGAAAPGALAGAAGAAGSAAGGPTAYTPGGQRRAAALAMRERNAAAQAAATAEGAPSAATLGAPSADAASQRIETVSCHLDSVPVVTIEKSAPPKGLAADPGKLPAPPPAAVPLRSLGTFETITSLTPVNKTTVLVSIVNEPPGKGQSTQLAWCDLKAGRVTGDAALAGGHVLEAGDPTQGWLVTHGYQDDKRIVVSKWPQPDKAPEPAYSVALTTANHNPFAKSFYNVYLAGQRRAVITNGADQVILWSLEERRAEKLWNASDAAVSPGGRYLALADNDGMALFDLAAGRQLGYWQTGWLPVERIAFSPEGKQVALTYDRDLRVMDLATGQTRYQGVLPDGAVKVDDGLVWASENHVMVGREYLVDLEAGLVLWRYESDFRDTSLVFRGVGGRLCYFAQDWRHRIPTLCAVAAPHPEAESALASADPAQLFGVAPGLEISLQVNVPGADAERVRKALERQAAANGWKLNPAAPVRLTASLTRGAQKSRTYEGVVGGGSTTITYQPYIHTVTVTIDGQTAWSSQTESGSPGLVVAKAGQTLQRAAEEKLKPYLEFFEKLQIPKQLARPKFLAGLGASKFTVNGVISE